MARLSLINLYICVIVSGALCILFFPLLFCQVFGIPKEHRKSKPYHDHVFVFSIVDDHIWFRNYQVRDRGNSDNCNYFLS